MKLADLKLDGLDLGVGFVLKERLDREERRRDFLALSPRLQDILVEQWGAEDFREENK